MKEKKGLFGQFMDSIKKDVENLINTGVVFHSDGFIEIEGPQPEDKSEPIIGELHLHKHQHVHYGDKEKKEYEEWEN